MSGFAARRRSAVFISSARQSHTRVVGARTCPPAPSTVSTTPLETNRIRRCSPSAARQPQVLRRGPQDPWRGYDFGVTPINLGLDDELAARLERRAARAGIAPEALATKAIAEYL